MSFRKHPPVLSQIGKIHVKSPVEHRLDNGIPVYEINMGTQAVLKLDLVFMAGRWFEDKPLAARFTARLLKEGTQHKTSAEVAELIDFYGGTLKTRGGLDTATISLFCLCKHFEVLSNLTYEILTKPTFPQRELDDFAQTAKMNLKIEQTKNDVVAYREITEALYGHKHPYGYNSVPGNYDQIKREDIFHHFNKNYHAGNCKIILSGQTLPEHIEQLNQLFGKDFPNKTSSQPIHHPAPYPNQTIRLSIPDSMQAAIRIGRVLVGRKHPDFPGLYVLITLLGGYFGSRLMTNIREEKGYTYGIYATMDSLLNGNYFYISTETSNELIVLTIKEIYLELKRLREELISVEELERVRNYMLGTILSSLDGPFNVAALVKTMILEGMDTSFLDRLVDTIKTIQPKRLQELAQQYLQEEDLYEVVVE